MTTMEQLRNPRIKIVNKLSGESAWVNPDDICNGGFHATTIHKTRFFIEESELNKDWEVK